MESNGQTKLTYKSPIETPNVFNDEQSFYLFQRIQKISAALYLITNHLSDTEPIRHSIRDIATCLIKDISDIEIVLDKNNKTLIGHLTELHALLHVGMQTALFSEQNIILLLGVINQVISEITNTTELDQNFFAVDAPKTKKTPETRGENVTATPQIKPVQQEQAPIHKAITKTPVVVAKKQTNREEGIIAVIKEKGVVGIKDIAYTMPEVSEKTIQRDLQKMVEKGIVLKEGERRWSTYSLRSGA